MSAEKTMKGFKDGDEKKSLTTNHPPLTRSRARQVQTKNPAPAVTKRRPLVQTMTVNEESDAERRGVLKQRNEDPRKKTTADMKKTHGPFLDACKSFLSQACSDVDDKYKNHPQYVSGVASKIASYFERLERERLRGDGVVLQSSKRYADLKDYRTRVVNWIFSKGYHMRVPSDTLHLAVYYVDRFLETYNGPDVNSTTVAVTALHLASKFEDVDALYLDQILRCIGLRALKESDVLDLEVAFFNHLEHFVGLTTTHFASRYLHAIDRETVPAEGHTARYLCALSVCHFPFTGHYYSKIAAAAVFIAHNKYRNNDENSGPALIYPAALEAHSGYKLFELQEVVLEMVDLIKRTEFMAATHARRTPTEMGMYAVYKRYAAVGVATGRVLPDFKSFFKTYQEPVATPEQLKEEDQEPIKPIQSSKETDSATTSASSEDQSVKAEVPVKDKKEETEDEDDETESDASDSEESSKEN